jgi:hypothetical protein
VVGRLFAVGVSGGSLNTASGLEGASVLGGNQNTASGRESSVLGGFGNAANGDESSVLGGFQNTVSGNCGTVRHGAELLNATSGRHTPHGGRPGHFFVVARQRRDAPST